MSHRPVYRYPPRSHAYNCPCPRCVQCRRDRASSGGGIGIIVPFFLAAIFAVWPYAVWHGCKYSGGSGLSGCGDEAEWVWNAQSWIACGIWWGLLVTPLAVVALTTASGRRQAPPKGRLRVEALTAAGLPPPPPSITVGPPACQHLNAVKVDSVSVPGLIYHCWCPDCDPECKTPLPANFKRPCCGTGPGNPHWYSCPQAEPETGAR